MRQEIIRAALLHRVRQRPNLVLVALVGGIFCIFRLTADLPNPGILELVLPFALLFGHLALSPVPWQWTGNDDPRAGLGRGFFQAFCCNTVWLGVVLFGLFVMTGPPGGGFLPQRPPPPPFLAFPPHGTFHAFHPGLGLGLINLAFGIAFGWVFAEKEATEAKERLTAGLLRQSRAKALQNQLEPHVLYNALSSLSELVYEDPLAAEEVITRLADLYRMLTVHSQADQIPLGQERRLVEAYLAMEQMRLGERLTVQWDWPEGADQLLAPPLLLQPLVENAIKHGISPCDRGGALVISCAPSGSSVTLAVENSGRVLRADAGRGIGLGNLEARLALWTEVVSAFSLTSAEGWTVAQVRWTQGAAL
jgi:hypothetical protein